MDFRKFIAKYIRYVLVSEFQSFLAYIVLNHDKAADNNYFKTHSQCYIIQRKTWSKEVHRIIVAVFLLVDENLLKNGANVIRAISPSLSINSYLGVKSSNVN